MAEACSICKQPFREGEAFEMVRGHPCHPNRDGCIAAVIRRCAEIAAEQADPGIAGEGYKVWQKAVNHVHDEIRREFAEVLKNG